MKYLVNFREIKSFAFSGLEKLETFGAQRVSKVNLNPLMASSFQYTEQCSFLVSKIELFWMHLFCMSVDICLPES